MVLRMHCGLVHPVGEGLQADGQAAPDQATEPVTARAILEQGASEVSQEKSKISARNKALKLNKMDCRP
jgi:hypothetical protein